MKTRLLIIALLVNLASTTLVHAQQQTGPSGAIGWSESATLCKLLPGSAANNFDYVTGAVNFTSTSSGTIGLACSVPGTTNQLSPSGINAFAFSYLNAAGLNGGCTVGAFFVDRTTGLNSGWSTAKSYSGKVWTVDIGLTSNTFPLNTAHFYEVDIYLFRPKSAVGVCNPAAYGAYTEEIIF